MSLSNIIYLFFPIFPISLILILNMFIRIVPEVLYAKPPGIFYPILYYFTSKY